MRIKPLKGVSAPLSLKLPEDLTIYLMDRVQISNENFWRADNMSLRQRIRHRMRLRLRLHVPRIAFRSPRKTFIFSLDYYA